MTTTATGKSNINTKTLTITTEELMALGKGLTLDFDRGIAKACAVDSYVITTAPKEFLDKAIEIYPSLKKNADFRRLFTHIVHAANKGELALLSSSVIATICHKVKQHLQKNFKAKKYLDTFSQQVTPITLEVYTTQGDDYSYTTRKARAGTILNIPQELIDLYNNSKGERVNVRTMTPITRGSKAELTAIQEAKEYEVEVATLNAVNEEQAKRMEQLNSIPTRIFHSVKTNVSQAREVLHNMYAPGKEKEYDTHYKNTCRKFLLPTRTIELHEKHNPLVVKSVYTIHAVLIEYEQGKWILNDRYYRFANRKLKEDVDNSVSSTRRVRVKKDKRKVLPRGLSQVLQQIQKNDGYISAVTEEEGLEKLKQALKDYYHELLDTTMKGYLTKLDEIEIYAKPVYKPSEKGNTQRLFGDSYVGQLPKCVRHVLCKDFVELDLKQAQLAIAAYIWKCPKLNSLLSKDVSIWVELIEWMGWSDLDIDRKADLKSAIKKAVYSLIFGMSLSNLKKQFKDDATPFCKKWNPAPSKLIGKGLKRRLVRLSMADHLFKHPVMKELLSMREEKIKEIEKARGMESPYGWVECKKGMTARSVLATVAQAWEQYILNPLFDLIQEESKKAKPKCFLAGLLHDAIFIKVSEKRLIPFWINKLTRALKQLVSPLGLNVSLERAD